MVSEPDNRKRKRIHRFDPVMSHAVRIECLSTHGAPEARVYEVRLYAVSL